MWSDFKGLGEVLAGSLYDLELRPYDRGELLARLRVIADTQAEIDKERLKKQTKGGQS